LKVVASATVATGALVMSLFPIFLPVAIAQTSVGVADAVFPSAIAAISLGIVGPKAFTQRVGRNEAFTHAGTALTALAAGVAGWLIAPGAVLWLVATLAVASIWAVLQIDAGAIDHALARGTDSEHEAQPTALRSLLGCRPLLMFVTRISLFHFANAAMLPLLGEKLALGNKGTETLSMAGCITHVHWAVYRRERPRDYVADPGADRDRRSSSSGSRATAFGCRQQRPGGLGLEAVHWRLARSATLLARCRHGLDARRQFYAGRIGRQSDCGAAST
jgi:uncharacterized MAPEG superfamily protein